MIILCELGECTAPVQELYFVKENATTTGQHIPYSAHLREVSMVRSFALYVIKSTSDDNLRVIIIGYLLGTDE